jgi:hypothetical protein
MKAGRTACGLGFRGRATIRSRLFGPTKTARRCSGHGGLHRSMQSFTNSSPGERRARRLRRPAQAAGRIAPESSTPRVPAGQASRGPESSRRREVSACCQGAHGVTPKFDFSGYNSKRFLKPYAASPERATLDDSAVRPLVIAPGTGPSGTRTDGRLEELRLRTNERIQNGSAKRRRSMSQIISLAFSVSRTDRYLQSPRTRDEETAIRGLAHHQ